MDRAAIARAQRRRQALEALEFERNRAAALQEQLEVIVTELEGPALDEATFARMAPEDVELVRAAFQPAEPEAFELEGLDEEWLEVAEGAPEDERDEQEEREEQEAEIARLEQEIASSSRRQQAFERYLEALGE